jgi:hypothetical protein
LNPTSSTKILILCVAVTPKEEAVKLSDYSEVLARLEAETAAREKLERTLVETKLRQVDQPAPVAQPVNMQQQQGQQSTQPVSVQPQLQQQQQQQAQPQLQAQSHAHPSAQFLQLHPAQLQAQSHAHPSAQFLHVHPARAQTSNLQQQQGQQSTQPVSVQPQQQQGYRYQVAQPVMQQQQAQPQLQAQSHPSAQFLHPAQLQAQSHAHPSAQFPHAAQTSNLPHRYHTEQQVTAGQPQPRRANTLRLPHESFHAHPSQQPQILHQLLESNQPIAPAQYSHAVRLSTMQERLNTVAYVGNLLKFMLGGQL